MAKLAVYEKQMLRLARSADLLSPIPIAVRWRRAGVVPASSATTCRSAVDTENHLIVTHEVTKAAQIGHNWPMLPSRPRPFSRPRRSRPLPIAATSSSLEILACHEAGITVTLPKPMTSGAKSDGRFGKQDFVYLPDEDVYRCPAGEQLTYRTNEEDGKKMRAIGRTPVKNVHSNRNARQGQSDGSRDGSTSTCSMLRSSASSKSEAMRQRRETVEHPFGTMKARMGATHFLCKTLPKVADRDGTVASWPTI